MRQSDPSLERQSKREEWIQMIWITLTLVLSRLTLAGAGAALSLYLFIQLAYVMASGIIRPFDLAVLAYFQSHQPPWLHAAMSGITLLGGGYVLTSVVLLALAGFAWKREWRDALLLLLASIGGFLILFGLKALFQRPRPDTIYDVLGYAFPSGHAFFSLLIYGFLAYRLTRDASPRIKKAGWTAAGTLILTVGLSRILLGVHYPSDVAAGYAAALPWLWGSMVLPVAFQGRSSTPTREERLARFHEGKARFRRVAAHLPEMRALIRRLIDEPQLPRWVRGALSAIHRYLRWRYNLIPNPVPYLGVADDLLAVGFAVNVAERYLPREAIRRHWTGETDLFGLLREAKGALRNLFGVD